MAPGARGPDVIAVRGAREHNLKNVDLDLPRNAFVVVTGVSGSGKSSLAFDTIYAEGQRRYVESLSAYARQFLGQMEKPAVDSIDGLSPAIAIEQRTTAKNPRSTVATTTELYDYLRILFARVGVQHCPSCERSIGRMTSTEIVDQLLTHPTGTRLILQAPLVRGRKGEHKKVLEKARAAGYLRVRVDGEIKALDEPLQLDPKRRHTIGLVVDRLKVDATKAQRLADSLEATLKAGDGVAEAWLDGSTEPLVFSEDAACVDCGLNFEALEPRNFSFNSPYGACRTCDGLGQHLEVDPALVVPDPSLSIAGGALKPWGYKSGNWYGVMLKALARHLDFSLTTPFGKLPKKARQAVLYGTGEDELKYNWKSKRMAASLKRPFEGVIHNLERRYRQTQSAGMREEIARYMAPRQCPECQGRRLRRESLAVRLGGAGIGEVTSLSIAECARFFDALELTERQRHIVHDALKEITARLSFLEDVGLGYLSLDRSAATLSGGEAQRIRLATQIGSRLTGVLYVLDEPSIGLHPRDNRRLLRTLEELRDLGNTVLVVEHDRDTIEAADFVVDMGPGAGVHGGEVVVAGSAGQLQDAPKSLTGAYLAGARKIPRPSARRPGTGKTLRVVGASAHNLQELDVELPLGTLTCVTGVSGSGKSTLVLDVIHRALAAKLHNGRARPGAHRRLHGSQHLDKVIDIDQSPIGRTPRSNPATYIGAWTPIRELFAQLKESKVRGYAPGRFSFNVKGGRCEACSGDGLLKIEMHFLPDVYVTCDVCRGRRFSRETLEVTYRGHSIADVLDMTVDEAAEFFEPIPRVSRKLATLRDVGLGYLRLGQPATTLSGGEAQRVKLTAELSKVATGRTLYILDEPTTGLHLEDVRVLLEVLERLVERGNTVLVIEHHLDVVTAADWVIDLGPEGGDGGGHLVVAGTPESVAETAASHTGRALLEHWETTRLDSAALST